MAAHSSTAAEHLSVQSQTGGHNHPHNSSSFLADHAQDVDHQHNLTPGPCISGFISKLKLYTPKHAGFVHFCKNKVIQIPSEGINARDPQQPLPGLPGANQRCPLSTQLHFSSHAQVLMESFSCRPLGVNYRLMSTWRERAEAKDIYFRKFYASEYAGLAINI